MVDKSCPLVSIGIPTFNRANGYLKNALACSLNQTYDNIEVIVCDNCSTDHTESLVRESSSRRLRYIRHKENIGPYKNFNFCLAQARGDYFLLLHDDDMIDEDFVETCITRANFEPTYGLIQTGVRVINASGRFVSEKLNYMAGVSLKAYFESWFEGKTAWYLCNTLFNTQKLRDIGGFHSKKELVQDGVAIARIVADEKRVDVPEVKASFRKHSDQITFTRNVEAWCDDYLALLDIMCAAVNCQTTTFRSKGLRFFCRLNYNRACAIQQPWERLRTYLMVYRKFDYVCSPFSYILPIPLLNRIRFFRNSLAFDKTPPQNLEK